MPETSSLKPSVASAFSPMSRIPELDILRFLAATMVVAYHFTYRPIIHGVLRETAFGSWQSVSRFGYLGVPLFFMISGFVILWSAQARSAAEFAIARVARLYPTFWVCMLLTSLILALTRPGGISHQIVLANLTMMPRLLGFPYVDLIYWTLFVEWKFYLLIFFILFLRSMHRIDAWVAVWLAGCVLSLWIPAHWLRSLILYPFGPYFISGCLFYLIRSKGVTDLRGIALLFSCWLCILHTMNLQPQFIQNVNTTSNGIVTAIVVAFHAIFAAITFIPAILPASLWWFWLGLLTYPLYLLHNQIGKVLWSRLPESVSLGARLFLMIVIVYLLAWAVAEALERRAHKQFQRWLLGIAHRMKLV